MTTFPSCIPKDWPPIPEEYLPPNVPALPICELVEANGGSKLEAWLEENGLPSPGTWSWRWFTFTLPDSFFENAVTGDAVGGVLLGLLLVALSYGPLHRLWTKRSVTYKLLHPEQQVVVIQHSIQALFLAILFAPITWSMLSTNFQVPLTERFAKSRFSFIGSYMVWIIGVYIMELAARYRSVRWLVVVHHLCATADALLPLFALSGTNARCASVLTYFISWEAPVFTGLVMYRLFPLNKWTPRVIRFGMMVFGLSRPVQLAWIIMIVASLWDDMVKWHGISQILFGVVFSCLQLYTLTIHNVLLKKCLKAQIESQKSSLPQTEHSPGESSHDETESTDPEQNYDRFTI